MGNTHREACAQCGLTRAEHADPAVDHAYVTPQARARVIRLDAGAPAYWGKVDTYYARRGMTDDDAYDHYRERTR